MQVPELFRFIGGSDLLELQMGFPACLAEAHGQGIQRHQTAFGAALEVTVERQVVDLDRLAVGVGAFELRRVQTHRCALQGAFAPRRP
ncbi:hypothetical protein D3C75_1231890 [compost metagenome]